MTTVRVRPATPADVPTAHALDLEAFGLYGTAESQETIAARQRVFPAGFLVADRDGEMIGYASAEKWLTERAPALDESPTLLHHPDGQVFCITAMAVWRKWQNHGVGSALLEALLNVAQLQKCHTVILETTHAQHFYAQRHFQVAYIRQERGVDLIVMKCSIV